MDGDGVSIRDVLLGKGGADWLAEVQCACTAALPFLNISMLDRFGGGRTRGIVSYCLPENPIQLFSSAASPTNVMSPLHFTVTVQGLLADSRDDVDDDNE